jgi:ADP-heptose:LPS heptosyltransferase
MTDKTVKAIGFNQGQYGDLCMNLVAAKSFKTYFPDSELYFGINKKYESIKEIFYENPLVQKIHIWDKYDGWPSNEDVAFIERERFDYVFHAMPHHPEPDWYLKRHQTEEVCYVHGLKAPENLQISLNKYFATEKNNKYVAVNLFAETRGSDKMPSLEKSKQICQLIIKMGYTPVQIGLPDQPQICEKRFIGTFFDTIKFVLSCDFLITVDSAIAWIASGYSFPVLGLYSYTYYPQAQTSKNWQPINPNAIYLEKNLVENIDINEIENSILKF